jgi:hypothetical protein
LQCIVTVSKIPCPSTKRTVICEILEKNLENQASALSLPPLQVGLQLQEEALLPRCGTFLLIGSDPYSDAEFTALRSFWLWEPLKGKWIYVPNWEEHNREAKRKFEEFAESPRSGQNLATETRRPLKNWIH